MSYALLIREGTDDLPVGRSFILLDSDAGSSVIHHGSGKPIRCNPKPTVDELAGLVASLIPEARRKSQAIIVNSNVLVPPEMRGWTSIYQDEIGERPWLLLALPKEYDLEAD